MRKACRAMDEAVRSALSEAARRGALCAPRDRALREAMVRRREAGELVSPLKGAFCEVERWGLLARQPADRCLVLARTVSARHPKWVFCRSTAACALGLRISYRLLGVIEVACTGGARSACAGLVARRYVRDPEPVRVGGLLVTSPRITAMDVMRTAPPQEGLVVADALLAFTGMSASQLVEQVVQVGRGLSGIDRALRIAAHADGRSESGGESIARASMLACGFVPPVLQVEVENPIDASRFFRVDFMWVRSDGAVVICELDGQEKRENALMTEGRSTSRLLWEERHRESLLGIRGARIVRLSFSEACDRAAVRQKLELAGVPYRDTPEGRALMGPEAAMRGGHPAPGGAVIRGRRLVYEP